MARTSTCKAEAATDTAAARSCRKDGFVDRVIQESQLPLCADRPMSLTRVLEREYLGHLLQTYQCRRCRVSYTVGIPDSEESNDA